MLRNRRVQLPDIRRRNFDELRERAILINTDNPQILADVRFAQPALVTVPATDVHLRADKISRPHRGNFVANPLHHAAKLVPQSHRRLDAPLRPSIPPINVQVRPANRSRTHTHQHIRRSNRRHRRIFKGKAPRRLHLAQSFHRGWHQKAAPRSSIAMLAHAPISVRLTRHRPTAFRFSRSTPTTLPASRDSSAAPAPR